MKLSNERKKQPGKGWFPQKEIRSWKFNQRKLWRDFQTTKGINEGIKLVNQKGQGLETIYWSREKICLGSGKLREGGELGKNAAKVNGHGEGRDTSGAI